MSKSRRPRKVCLHCRNASVKVNRPRGLCWRCYQSPQVRRLYAAEYRGGKLVVDPRDGMSEMTQEEVDALVAEQLPTWWDAETKRLRKLQGESDV
jgi:hypothetical protein